MLSIYGVPIFPLQITSGSDVIITVVLVFVTSIVEADKLALTLVLF